MYYIQIQYVYIYICIYIYMYIYIFGVSCMKRKEKHLSVSPSLQAHLLDGPQDRPGGRGLHPAEAGLPPRAHHHPQVAAEGRDGPAGQGAVGAAQEAGHRPAGREGQEEPGQRGTLSPAPCGSPTHWTTGSPDPCITTGRLPNDTFPLVPALWTSAGCLPRRPPLAALTEAFCTDAVFLYIVNKSSKM